MEFSRFPFIKNTILQRNLDLTFRHVVDLLSLVESGDYAFLAKSAFRKTIVIHTASIVEALLFYILDTKFSDADVDEYYCMWKFKDQKELYRITNDRFIVAGEYVKNVKDGQKKKMNLGQIAIFLENKKIINKKIFEKINHLRVLRNKQHLNTQTEVRKYTKKDLEKAFSIASDIKQFVQTVK